jgi:hypothetical protein
VTDRLPLATGSSGRGQLAVDELCASADKGNRGTRDVPDGGLRRAESFTDAIAQVWPQGITQTCTVD